MASQGIRVGVRLRPLVPHEKGQKHCLAVNGQQVSVVPGVVGDAKDQTWKFDQSMDSTDSSSVNFCDNAECYEAMGHNIIEHALEGFNACLFCYGQTGTGKTTTILGDKENGPGILILMLKELFDEVTKEEARGGTITVNIQMLEEYNEQVFDLLAPKGSKKKIELHVLPHGVQVKNVENVNVTSVDDVMKCIDLGNSRKHIAATAMNPQSSRGHTVFKLAIEKEEDGMHVSSEVYFADLAGHENVLLTKVTGDRMQELSYINKSLMWLQQAIHGLSIDSHKKAKPGAHTNKISMFRNSKLTLLLANALTGNSLVNVIVTISPAAAHFSTSLSSLKFANEVKNIAVEVHSSAKEDPIVKIKHLEEEVAALKEAAVALKEELAAAQAGIPSSASTSGGAAQVSAESARASVSAEGARVSVSAEGAREWLRGGDGSGGDRDLQAAISELEDVRSTAQGLRTELEDSQKREAKLAAEREALLEAASKVSSGLSAALLPQMDASANSNASDQPIFGPNVARSLDAISAKVNELCKDLHHNNLGSESDQLVELLDRARTLVPDSSSSTTGMRPMPPLGFNGLQQRLSLAGPSRTSSPQRNMNGRPRSISPTPRMGTMNMVPGLPVGTLTMGGPMTMAMSANSPGGVVRYGSQARVSVPTVQMVLPSSQVPYRESLNTQAIGFPVQSL